MRLDRFDYPLPENLIADRPLPCRSDSRLMVVHRTDARIEHAQFRDLPGLLSRGDLLVFNDSKVIPARLEGTKRPGGARIEVLLLEEKAPLVWEALAQRAIRLSQGTIVDFTETDLCEVEEVLGEGRFLFRFDVGPDWQRFLDRSGSVPLPPYILRKREALSESERNELSKQDRIRYQTAYASTPGSSAAPTAGLHFDPPLLAELERRGIQHAEVTLHVGLDTFSPVTVEEVEDHKMKSEWCACPPGATLKICQRLEGSQGKVVAVGTTAARTLESYARAGWPDHPLRTELFLKPGDSFLATGALLTNFHLPKSTLLMLVSAFMGDELRCRAYQEAVQEKYRFYSYGDAMLIL
jgi:S-adenosylmethionine:tRNA ribosyltransferase-isomerase